MLVNTGSGPNQREESYNGVLGKGVRLFEVTLVVTTLI